MQAHKGGRNGASLATVMMVVALMMSLAFTVVAIAFNHLSISNKSANITKARLLAEAALAKTIDAMVKDRDFGLSGTAEERTVRVQLPSLPDGSEGLVTFDPDVAASSGVAYSTNNKSESPTAGAGNKLVPGESFHLVALGKVKNSTVRVEAIIVLPKFPFSMAAQGAIKSNGGLVVASVKPGVSYDLNYPIHEDDLEPGHIVSNSKAGDGAVILSGENKIYGDLQSASGATIASDTSILGEVRLNSNEETLPALHASSYDPELEAGLQTVNSGAGQLEVEGYNKSYSSLTVDNGIKLNGGVLFVDGDLTVNAGGVTGKGALIATGNLTIVGDGEASTDQKAALIADGDIVLKGASSSKAKFAGLVYTNGKLKAENLRLAGVFVAAGNESDVELSNTEIYEDPEAYKLEFSSTQTAGGFEPPPLKPDVAIFDGKTIPTTVDPAALTANLESFRNPNVGPNEPEYLFKFPYAGSSTGYAYMAPDNPIPVETSGPDSFVLDGSDVGMTIFGQPVHSAADAENAAVTGLEAAFLAEGRMLTQAEKDIIRAEGRRIFNSPTMAYSVSKSSADYTASNPGNGGSEGPPVTTNFEWSIDLSEFVSASDYMRVLYWADYHD